MHISSSDPLTSFHLSFQTMKFLLQQLLTITHEPKSPLKPFTNNNYFQIITNFNSFKAEDALISKTDIFNYVSSVNCSEIVAPKYSGET